MKYILISTAFPWRGGIAQSNEGLCRALNHTKGSSCKIISFSFLYPSFFFPNKSFKDTGKGPTDLNIVHKVSSINPFTWFSVAAQVRKEKPDVVIVRYWVPFLAPAYGSIVRLIKRDKDIKIVCLVDHVKPHERRGIDSLFAKYALEPCDSFMVFSEIIGKDLAGLVRKKRIACSPLPLLTNFGAKISKSKALRALKLKQGQRHLLFFGFIRKYKGLDLLLDAMADPRVKKLDIKLMVIGEFFDPKEPYEEHVRSLGLQQNVMFRSEYVPGEQVKNYFCAADLIVQPYRTASQSAVTPVAYHFERPMLVTDVGGLAETVPDGVVGYVVKPSAKAIADAIVDFYQKRRESKFEAGVRMEKKNLQWDVFVRRFQVLLR